MRYASSEVSAKNNDNQEVRDTACDTRDRPPSTGQAGYQWLKGRARDFLGDEFNKVLVLIGLMTKDGRRGETE